MLTAGEIGAIESALDAYRGWLDNLRAVLRGIDPFFESDKYERAYGMVREAEANLERFAARRSELVEMDPSDHEAVLAYVSSLRRIAGSDLPALIAGEPSARDVYAGAIRDTLGDIGLGLKITVPVALIAGAIFLFLYARR